MLKKLLGFKKQRPSLDNMPAETQEEFLEARKTVGKPHVPNPPSKN